MKEAKRKKPADYPQLAFRVTAEDKVEILELLKEVTKAMNKGRSEDQKVLRGNNIAVQAIKLGLGELKKRKKT